MHRGSCLCGGVRYELDAAPGRIGLCHCRSCRKSNGSAYAANVAVAEQDFHIVAGAELLKEFESSPGKQRVFCGTCGAPVYSRNEKRRGIVRLRIGLFDTPIQRRPEFHFMVADKAEWDEICDNLPQYPGFEPGRR
ncbi:MAG: hypothetical protein JWR16_679 [Nevskia sp.]|nr:hypothetical protein [Nevskia sp.]